MKLQKAFDPQISQIDADGSGRHLLGSPRLPGESWHWPLFSPGNLSNLRNLRIEPGFIV